MEKIYNTILSAEDIAYLTQHAETLAAKARLITSADNTLADNTSADNTSASNTLAANTLAVVNFSIELTDSIKKVIQEQFGLTISSVPMRWIKGDTPEHTDKSAMNFKHTYLIYLMDSIGEFILDNTSYTIVKNTAFKFNEGVAHKTINTGTVPRLLLGPMNEFGATVGGIESGINYSDTVETTFLGYTDTFIIGEVAPGGDLKGYTQWKISSTSNPDITNLNIIYSNGDTLPPDFLYNLQPYVPPPYRIFKVKGQEIRLKQPIEGGNGTAFSLDGKKVCGYRNVSGTYYPTVWDVKTGKTKTLEGTGIALAFSPDGKKVCGVSIVSNISYPIIWDVKSGKTKTLEGLGIALAFSPDGKKVCGVSIVSIISYPTVWDVKSGIKMTLAGTGYAYAFSPDGKKVCGYNSVSNIAYPTVWDIKSGIKMTLEGRENAVAFSPDGKKVCGYNYDSFSDEAYPTIWHVKSGIKMTLAGTGIAVAFSPDGKKVCGFTDDELSSTKIWGVKGNLITTINNVNNYGISFSLDSKKIYTTTNSFFTFG